VKAVELAAAARVSYRQIDYWTRRGFIVPDPRIPGIGHRRHYAPDEVRRTLVLAALVHAGIGPEIAAKAARTAVVVDDDPDVPHGFATMIDTLAIFGRLP
jgi:hypothetical protein